jgi:hypothetical protein
LVAVASAGGGFEKGPLPVEVLRPWEARLGAPQGKKSHTVLEKLDSLRPPSPGDACGMPNLEGLMCVEWVIYFCPLLVVLEKLRVYVMA